jgi:ankyrin repeat protein
MSSGSNNKINGQSAGSPQDRREELLLHCKSASLSEEGLLRIIERCEWTPDTVDARRRTPTPLHYACNNKNATLGIIQLLIDAAPDSVRSMTNNGNMPLHILCLSSKVDETAAIEILKLLIEMCPEALRHANDKGDLPIHLAAERKSPEFCRVLIEAYPGSEQRTDGNGALPLHLACYYNTLAAVEYLYQQYPEAINHAITEGFYPIHHAISTKFRDKPAAAVEVVRFLLGCDPNQKLKLYKGMSLLHYACLTENNDSSIDAGIQIIEMIFDAHPEAIEDYLTEDNTVSANIQRFHYDVQAFINWELVMYVRPAKDHLLMTTPGADGQLPLHRVLESAPNVRLGTIKLLVRRNPAAVISPNINGTLPLHIACEHHVSTEVIEYLVGLDPSSLDAVDRDGNTALHYACRGTKHHTIAMLVKKYDAVSVSRRNAEGKLPIEVLWEMEEEESFFYFEESDESIDLLRESNEVNDRESVKYMGSVFQLVRAYPDMIAQIE